MRNGLCFACVLVTALGACRRSEHSTPDAEAASAMPAAGAADAAGVDAPIAEAGEVDASEPADAATEAAPGATAGPVEIYPQRSVAIHSHGGEAAHLRSARFVVHNPNATAATLSVLRVDYLTGSSCETPPTRVRSSPKADGISLRSALPAKRVSIAAGATAPITVEFSPVDAYYVYCNRFAFRVTFDAGGTRLQSTAETEVHRVDPPRR
jgi:hypothetical protein